jgi:hypothetical protein
MLIAIILEDKSLAGNLNLERGVVNRPAGINQCGGAANPTYYGETPA